MANTPNITVWVGLDWADQAHAYALRQGEQGRTVVGSIQQKAEELDVWIQGLRQRAGDGLVAVAVEQSRGALVYALMEYEFVVIYPINPKSMANYRKALYPSGGKSDPTDAALILDYLLKQREHLRLWQPDSPTVRLLRLASEQRRKLVDDRTALTNRMQDQLKSYFPQALEWIGPLKTTLACDFLERWGDLPALKKAKPASLRKFFRDHACRNKEQLEPKIKTLGQARPLTSDSAIVTVGRMAVQSLARQVRLLNESIEAFDKQIAEIFEQHEDFVIFNSLPGSGSALGPRLLSLFGEDRQRFDAAEEVQMMTGIAPVVKSSGKTRLVKWRWACPKFLRQTMHEFANTSRKFCAWAGAYYAMQLARGKTHHTALRALAFKWIRIIFRCWKQRCPYDDQRYMQSLRDNNALLLAYL